MERIIKPDTTTAKALKERVEALGYRIGANSFNYDNRLNAGGWWKARSCEIVIPDMSLMSVFSIYAPKGKNFEALQKIRREEEQWIDGRLWEL